MGAKVLTIGRKLIHYCFVFSNKFLSRGGGTLSLAIIFCFFGAMFTEWLGLHAIFGAFLVGIAVGDSEHFSHRTKEMLHDVVTYIFAPLFFVSIGFRVNFVQNFDINIILFVLTIAVFGKMLGGFIGAKLAKFGNQEAIAVGFGMNARGSQEIVLGLIALNAGLISDKIFVGLVIMTFTTIMIAGPAVKYFMSKQKPDESALGESSE